MEDRNFKEEKVGKQKNTGVIIVIVLLVIVIIGLIGYICYDKGIIFNSEKNSVVEKEESNEDKVEKETIISDNLLIKDLSEKITYLNTQYIYTGYNGFNNAYDRSNSIFNYNFRKDVYKNSLTDDDKLDIVLNSLVNNYEDLTVSYENMDTTSQELFKSYVEQGSINSIVEKQISSTKVEERYLSLFGETLTNHRSDHSCPFFVYDSKNKVYYYTRACGGTASGNTYLYKNKFTTKGNNAYVYVNIGYTTDDNNVYNGYPDYELVKDNNADIVESYVENFSINESNYSK